MLLPIIRRVVDVARDARTRRVVAFVRDILFGYILLLASAILPVCGWHRAWFRLGGWWIYPAAGAIIATGYYLHQRWMMLALTALVVMDALTLWQLILQQHREAAKP